MSRQPLSPEERRKQRIKSVGRYSGMAFQLFGAILVGVFIGKWLDAKAANERPFFAVGGAVLFLGAALWSIFRQLLNEGK